MKTERHITPSFLRHHALGGLVVVLGAALLALPAAAQTRARSGKAVVDTYCANCHVDGKDGAPKIGDAKAWSARATQGLSGLTANALQGIRNMPAHGGNPGLNDIEIERAITRMVNLSGGHWVEPLGGAGPAVVRTGEQVVRGQCASCHAEGKDGAPKIGDRKAWLPRLAKGLDTVVRNAVHGHGGMPARGGLPDLSDAEIQGAVVYMFNQGLPPAAPPAAAAPAANPYHKVVDGTDVYLGIERADSVLVKGKPSGGSGEFRVSISLYDTKGQTAITNAAIKVSVSDGRTTETKTLKGFAADGRLGYAGNFRMPGPNPYTITATFQRPGVAGSGEASFEYRVW